MALGGLSSVGVVAVGVLSSVGFAVVAVEFYRRLVLLLLLLEFYRRLVLLLEFYHRSILAVAGCSLPQLLQKRALAGSITPQFTHFFV